MHPSQRTTTAALSSTSGQGSPSRAFDRMEAEGRTAGACRQDAQRDSQGLTDGWNFRLLV